MKQYLIGLDNGGTSVKAGLYDRQGRLYALAQRTLPIISPQAGYMERDMEVLWQKNVECLRELMERCPIPLDEIGAMSFSGHGKGLYPLDRQGNVFCHAILSSDQRGKQIAQRWRSAIQDKVSEKTFQDIQEAQPVVLLAWLKRYARRQYDQIGYVFSVKDYIRYRLSQEAYAELTDFSGNNLIDLEKRCYHAKLLDLFGIEEMRACLPPLVNSTDICGYVCARAAEETGLPQGLPLVAGMFDIDACAIGSGIVKPDRLSVIAGTWSINTFLSLRPIQSDRVRMNSLYAQDPYYLVEESSPVSCGNLDWILWQMMGSLDYTLCNQLVESVTEADSDVIFMPFLYGCNDGEGSAGFLNVKYHHTKAHLLRAVFEGVAFAHRQHIERLRDTLAAPNIVRIAGGIVHSQIWLQIFADILQLPLEVVEGEELGTLGAAMCAGVGIGLYKNFDMAAHEAVRICRTILPDSGKRAVYERKYHSYRKAIQSLKPYWEVNSCMKH